MIWLHRDHLPGRPPKETSPFAERDASRRDVRPYTARGCWPFSQSPAGELLIEYKGEVTSWRRTAARERLDAGHMCAFGLSGGRVIDGSRDGNSARFLNHACEPNCEAIEMGDRVFIHALSAINAGEKLFIDYGLVIDARSPTRFGHSTHVTTAPPPAAAQ